MALVQEKPSLIMWPLIVAALFLLVQHWIDRYDPKLAKARQSRKDLTVIFPIDYEAEEGRQ